MFSGYLKITKNEIKLKCMTKEVNVHLSITQIGME